MGEYGCLGEPRAISESLKPEMLSWLWREGDVNMEEYNLATLLALKTEEGGHKSKGWGGLLEAGKSMEIDCSLESPKSNAAPSTPSVC